MSARRVLVVGGCGFVGYHIVKALVEDPTSFSVHVSSRNPSRNRIGGAQYYAGNITSSDELCSLFDKTQPELVIHTASPISTGNAVHEHQETNVEGTRNLLEAAMANENTKAFIYTSSAEVIGGSSLEFATEDAPLLSSNSRVDRYATSKAIADQTVLNANGKSGLRTLCLRPSVIYGERDSQLIPAPLQALQDGRHHYQIGNNKTLFDTVSVTNVARCHLMASKALLSDVPGSGPKVDGEAFFVTDGSPLPFWTFTRKIWAAAGDKTAPEEVTVIPAWFMLNLASVAEWVCWASSLGGKRPKFLRRQHLSYTCMPKTYSIDKARERLGTFGRPRRPD